MNIEIPTSYVKICFHALKETVTTTEDIARLLVTTKLIVNNITSAYKSNVQNSNGDIGLVFLSIIIIQKKYFN